MDDERLRALSERKAHLLVRAHFGVEPAGRAPFGAGAVLHDATTAWAYAPGAADRVLGRALAVAASLRVRALHVIVDANGGDAARQGARLAPAVAVWTATGTDLVPTASRPLPQPAPAPAAAATLTQVLRDGGVEVVVEHGVVFGEVRGLQVARVRVLDTGAAVLDVGVGRFDQEANALLHGQLPTELALERAVHEVRVHRRPGAPGHPVNRLARERWLRRQVLEQPGLVGLARLDPVSPPLPAVNLRDPLPAAAVGSDRHGATVLVVCSVGVDLDLVPVSADLVAREHASRAVLVTPGRDQVPAARAMATWLPVPADWVAVEGEWPAPS